MDPDMYPDMDTGSFRSLQIPSGPFRFLINPEFSAAFRLKDFQSYLVLAFIVPFKVITKVVLIK